MASDAKVIVVTGAGGGIGEGIIRAAAQRGMRMVLADISRDAIENIASELNAAGLEALAVPTDVRDPSALDRLYVATIERFGAVDILVNNAGVETLGNSWELSTDQWDRALGVNIAGPIHGVRAFAGHMVEAGKPAHIINIASLASLSMMAAQSAYIVTKHAILSFSECLHLEMQRSAPHVSVSVALPGPVATRIFSDASGGSNPANVEHQRKTMEHILAAHGMKPNDAGEIILSEALAGKFWIATHADMLAEYAGQRGEYLTNLATPNLKPSGRQVLGD